MDYQHIIHQLIANFAGGIALCFIAENLITKSKLKLEKVNRAKTSVRKIILGLIFAVVGVVAFVFLPIPALFARFLGVVISILFFQVVAKEKLRNALVLYIIAYNLTVLSGLIYSNIFRLLGFDHMLAMTTMSVLMYITIIMVCQKFSFSGLYNYFVDQLTVVSATFAFVVISAISILSYKVLFESASTELLLSIMSFLVLYGSIRSTDKLPWLRKKQDASEDQKAIVENVLDEDNEGEIEMISEILSSLTEIEG